MGQGYVGLPLAMRAVAVGARVQGFDTDEERTTALSCGQSFVEDIADADIAAALASGRYSVTSKVDALHQFDVAVITVPTPLRDGAPDLSYIESAARCVASLVRPGSCVILESTTYPGTTEELVAPILEAGSGLEAGRDFALGYSPERIDPGNTRWTLENTPKIVSGMNADSTSRVEAFYGALVDRTVRVSGTREAELTKLLENTFRHVNIGLINELAIHANALGINIWEVVDAAKTKPFGFMSFYPGPGVGGHCLPIDPSYLSWRIERELGAVSRFVKVANDVNGRMPAYVAHRVMLGLNRRRLPANGSTVLVIGLAYKKNSSDARESPATGVVRSLLDLGCQVLLHDPHVGRHPIDEVARRVDLTDEVLEQAAAVVLVTDHDCLDYDRIAAAGGYILDTRNRMRQHHVERL